MWKNVVVLKSALILLGHASEDLTFTMRPVDIVPCEGMLTLSAASDNIIRTKAAWDSFIEANPLVVIGAAASDCEGCCDSEPILRDLGLLMEGKAKLSYPEKHKKQKKIVRKEIKIARVDLKDKDFTEILAKQGIWFPMGTTILIGEKGRFTKYDGQFEHMTYLLHHMQRSVDPLVTLTSEEKIMSFLETRDEKIWEGDYSGQLCAKGESFDENHEMDEQLSLTGYNTRVVAFFYDKKEYKDEIRILSDTARHLSNRFNLRVGVVTDQRLVTKMKKTHPELFLEVGMSVMVLRRYDGTLFKLNVMDTQPVRYVWWITVHSTKPIDQLTGAGFQITESARMPVVTLFLDFKDPVVAEKSSALIKEFETLALQYQERFMFFWTDEERYLNQRRILGITWDELPSIAVGSVEHVIYAYPQNEPFERNNLVRWLQQVSLKKTQETEMRSTDFVKRQRDPTMAEFFLEKSINADRKMFDEVILQEDADSIMFIYSSENVNYAQRKACFQYNLVIEQLSNEAIYGDMVGRLLKFYSYDAYQHGFPKGIPFGQPPPQDTRGVLITSTEQRNAGVPTIYIFPAGQKSLPYTRFLKFPYADDIVNFIVDKSANYLKMQAEEFKGLGRSSLDEQTFQRRIDKEGVIELVEEYDEL